MEREPMHDSEPALLASGGIATLPDDFQLRLKNLSAAYALQLPETLEKIARAAERLAQGVWDEDSFQTLLRGVHGLAGTARTFGYELLGDSAGKLESYLNRLGETRLPPDDEQYRHMQALLSELDQLSIQCEPPVIDAYALSSFSHPEHGNRIYVVSAEPALAQEICVQLGYFGYVVTLYARLDDFKHAIVENSAVIVLMDIGGHDGFDVIGEIQRGRAHPVPVVFMSSSDEFSTRLEAVRAGSCAYLCKPISISNLIDKLDALTSSLSPVPYRVLIIDDSAALTAYYAMVLEQAGMVTQTLNNPQKVMESLFEFAPDLILIDIYMPECNGMELACVIRQLDAYMSIPIVFLSAEKNLDKQQLAMGLGADDFLTKPIRPLHLVSSVSSRIQRSLMLRAFMIRDSLTGLLNHSTIKEYLSREVALAKRQGSALSFAMLDIDHFKQVNDTYGHAAGDHVLKSLARLLKQRLREEEMVGRYGGEEFAVILSNTDDIRALGVMDAIRKDFSRLRHIADGREFTVTFSCGIADIAHFRDHAELCNAADKALYQAKDSGRNRVMLADAILIATG